ncbi:hypothetical protein [Ulvibacter litoralis]|uniref:hypothetical protein n=1 Tax=Ulvibacter litoralis TaxID=227084 RepID=UPI00167C3B1B|nr:hypothetical protein [Ulvibacter litoralis]GHC65527.1 hypothetical protein GCM10008083_33400 [Ulvibacter litoralis]
MTQEVHENSEFINSLIIAGIGLTGVILGVIISNIITWKLKSKESRLRIKEKIFDRRLKAHEDFLQITKLLRTTVSTNETDDETYFITYPGMLSSKAMFEDFLYKFHNAANYNSHWFEEKLRKEIFFTQDYLQNVQIHLKDIPDENCIEYAKILKTDFKELADLLEEKTIDFLLIDIHKINVNPKNREFQYSMDEIKKKLNETQIIKSWNDIKALKK